MVYSRIKKNITYKIADTNTTRLTLTNSEAKLFNVYGQLEDSTLLVFSLNFNESGLFSGLLVVVLITESYYA